MASPYRGLSEPDLLKIKQYLVDQLSGKVFQAHTLPGASAVRRLDSPAEIEHKLGLINRELHRCDPRKYPASSPSTRTVFRQTGMGRMEERNCLHPDPLPQGEGTDGAERHRATWHR